MAKQLRNVRESLLLALDTLRTHKFRSFLTILGVLIGTTTVIAVASIVTGLNNQLVNTMEQYGSRTIWVFKFEPGIRFHLTREERMRKPLKYEDAVAIRDYCPAVEEVASVMFFRGRTPPGAKYKGQDMLEANLQGSTASNFAINGSSFADGRPYTTVEDNHRRNVAVIGADVAKRLFLNEDPLGKEISVGGNSFQIVGVLEKRLSFLGDNRDDQTVFIPYWTFRKIYPQDKEKLIVAMATMRFSLSCG